MTREPDKPFGRIIMVPAHTVAVIVGETMMKAMS